MRSRYTISLDKMGMAASTLCAVHCALLPVLLTFLPLWGMAFLAEEWVEPGMLGLAAVLGIWSLTLAYRRHHRRLLPMLILLLGFVLIMAGHFLPYAQLEPVLIPLGGLIIALSHLVNWRLTSVCAHNAHDGKSP